MKTLKRNLLMAVLLTGGVFAFSECTKESVVDGVQNPSDTKALNANSQTGSNSDDATTTQDAAAGFLCDCITSFAIEPLSTSETDALITMREEELLAHDVYVQLYSLYKIPVFNNISKSETQHSEAVRTLLLKYNVTDPAANHFAGVFVNSDLQALYTSLVAQGKASLTAALTVGATIEDLDINDLHNHIAADVDNQDILFVFGNLEKGSRNHLRSFNRLLTAKGVAYTPQYISVEYFNQIISSAQETGPVVCPN
ncbi:MAG: DUF2202 domain-containing protein [Bacteroidota bacterium]